MASVIQCIDDVIFHTSQAGYWNWFLSLTYNGLSWIHSQEEISTKARHVGWLNAIWIWNSRKITALQNVIFTLALLINLALEVSTIVLLTDRNAYNIVWVKTKSADCQSKCPCICLGTEYCSTDGRFICVLYMLVNWCWLVLKQMQ